jgi:hypothetical protein
MSTLIAFFGIDDKPLGQVGHASAYLISESRISDANAVIQKRDAQKTFSAQNAPAIFGYVGDERIESLLKETVLNLDAGNSIFQGAYTSEQRKNRLCEWFDLKMPGSFPLDWANNTIVYIGRTDGEKTNQSEFHIWEFNRGKKSGWTPKELKVPQVSGPPEGMDPIAQGSGRMLLSATETICLGKHQKFSDFTCSYFRALTDALKIEHDIRSGDAPQVVMLPRGCNGQYIGVVYEGRKFVCGKLWNKNSPPVARWVDSEFDECDPKTLTKRQDRKRNPII